jgi:organic radical activating enzyme
MTSKNIPIGQALLERSSITAKIKELIDRINNNSISTINISTNVIEPCNEDVQELLKELEILQHRHQHIWKAITYANYETKTTFQNTQYRLIEIIEMIAEHGKHIKFYKELLKHCEEHTANNAALNNSRNRNRYDYSTPINNTQNDTKNISMINLTDIRNKIQLLVATKNTLQILLQEINWNTRIHI